MMVASGNWTKEERDLLINVLEMRAVCLALQTFLNIVKGKKILLMMDNTASLAYIRKQDGTK